MAQFWFIVAATTVLFLAVIAFDRRNALERCQIDHSIEVCEDILR